MNKLPHTTYDIIGENDINPIIQVGGYIAVALIASMQLWQQADDSLLRGPYNTQYFDYLEEIGFDLLLKGGTLEQSDKYTKRIAPLVTSIDTGERNCPFQQMLTKIRIAKPDHSIHILVFTLNDLCWDFYENAREAENDIAEEAMHYFGRSVSNLPSSSKIRSPQLKRKVNMFSGANPIPSVLR